MDTNPLKGQHILTTKQFDKNITEVKILYKLNILDSLKQSRRTRKRNKGEREIRYTERKTNRTSILRSLNKNKLFICNCYYKARSRYSSNKLGKFFSKKRRDHARHSKNNRILFRCYCNETS